MQPLVFVKREPFRKRSSKRKLTSKELGKVSKLKKRLKQSESAKLKSLSLRQKEYDSLETKRLELNNQIRETTGCQKEVLLTLRKQLHKRMDKLAKEGLY